MLKKILVIIDGAADLSNKALNGKTPFEAADMPNLDFLAKNGKMGYMYTINEETVPGSDNALISIFGNDPKLCRRGTYEAIGSEIELKKGDLAFRANFGTIENLKSRRVIDRRAGRTLTTEEAALLSKELNEKIKLECEFEFKNTVQHRGVLVLRGNFSDKISNIDPEWSNSDKKFEFDFSKPLDDLDSSKKSSDIINEFATQAFKVLINHPVNIERVKKGLLPANMIFLRGGGVEIPNIKKYKNWMSINSMPLEIGISKASGMKVFSIDYPKLKNMDSYENLYAGLNRLINFSKKIIKKKCNNYTGGYIQFKETDIPGHDNKPLDKKRMLELIDRKFFSFLKKFALNNKIKIVVTCDHSTPCKLKAHSSDPVPVLVCDWNKGYEEHFCENEAKRGSLGKIYGSEFMEKTGLNK